MIIPPKESAPELIMTPEHACQPVRAALTLIHDDLAEMGGPSNDPEQDAAYHTVAANEIARICGALCTEGCVRDSHNRLEELGLSLPFSADRQKLFDLVSGTLASGLFAEALRDEDEPEQQFRVREVEHVTGAELKEIVTRRMDVLKAPEVTDRIIRDFEPKPDGTDWTSEDVSEFFDQYITPVKDDKTWDVFARFIKGNIALGLSVYLYFQETFYFFRSSEPEDVERAADIARGLTMRDGSWGKTISGFRPGNPYEISEIDFNKLAAMIDENGWLNLYRGHGCSSVMHITDNPDEYVEWLLKDGELVDIVEGNPNILPPIERPAIEAGSTIVE